MKKTATWVRRLTPVLFLLILAMQLFVMVETGQQKEGFDIDEFFTYGLANSYKQPFISVPEDTWVSGERFSDYLTVGNAAHEYLNVYDNQIADVHPPLYYLCMHAMCSLHRSFTKWTGITLNMMFFSVTQLALFSLSWLLLTGGKKRGQEEASPLVCLSTLVPPVVYGFGVGAISSVVFIRMYAMMTMWTTILALVLVLLWQRGQTVWRMRALMAALVFGFLTQYYFVIIACFLCGAYFFARLSRKEGGQAARFAGACFFALVLAVGFFPWCLEHIFGGYRGRGAMESAFGIQFNDLTRWSGILFTILNRQQFGGFLALFMGLGIALALIPRKRAKHALPEGSKGAALWGLAAGLCYLVVIAVISPYKVDRYIFCIYPLVVLSVFVLLAQGAAALGVQGGAACVLAAAALMLPPQISSVHYLFQGNAEKLAVCEAHAEQPCVVLGTNDMTNNMLEFAAFEDICLLDKDAEEKVVPMLEELGRADEPFVLFERYPDDERLERIVQAAGAEEAALLFEDQYRVFEIR